MDPFSPRLLQIDAGRPAALEPVPFQGRVDELTLEKWIVENPDLVGEPLLVLGRRLAEFEEDKDRLDILALDRTGEIVLIELKVSEDFRLTGLQALAYARRASKGACPDAAAASAEARDRGGAARDGRTIGASGETRPHGRERFSGGWQERALRAVEL